MAETSPIDRRMTQAEQKIEAIRTMLTTHSDLLSEHRLILSGNKALEIPGLLNRVITLEKLAETGIDERKALMATGRGMLLGIAISSALGGGAIVGIIVTALQAVVHTT